MKTSLAERAKARRGEEDRRKRDAGELLRLQGRVRELEMLCAEINQKARALGPDEGYAVPLYLIERCEAAVGKLRVRLTPDNGCGCFLKTCPRCWPGRGEAMEGGK